jgi:hypothetical protein
MFRFLLASLCLLNLCAAFAPCHSVASSRRTAFGLSSSVAEYMDEDDELRFGQMLLKARECAFSDYGTAVDAREYLREILHMESGCVSGNLSGEICDNVDEVADLVSHLRVKATQPAAVPVPNVAVGLVSTVLLLLTSVVFLSTVDQHNGATPFVLEEWVWAAKGGYLENMIQHYVQNGGL